MDKKPSVYNMTDRELRTYKRKLRRKRERMKKIKSIILALCLIAICAVSYSSLISSANSGTESKMYKYYTGITVKSGDSLWSIADEFIDYGQYGSRESYVNEVCSINHIEDDSMLRAGQRLIVPYYSSEFVR